MIEEISLRGGTANRGRVHRVGDTVRRPMRPTSRATHALLHHLENVGFDGAPRFLGIDESGREVLTYVPGDAVTAPLPDWGLTDDALRSTGELLRRFHEAAAGFDPTPHTWSHHCPRPFDLGGMAHNDPNLDNVVFRDGRAVALIDFDLASPGAPSWDLATAARLWAPLRSPSDIDDVRRGRSLVRLRALVDAYGLDQDGRDRLVAALRMSHDWLCDIVRDGARRGVPGFVEYWTPEAAERARRTDAWLERNTEAIRVAMR